MCIQTRPEAKSSLKLDANYETSLKPVYCHLTQFSFSCETKLWLCCRSENKALFHPRSSHILENQLRQTGASSFLYLFFKVSSEEGREVAELCTQMRKPATKHQQINGKHLSLDSSTLQVQALRPVSVRLLQK